MNKVSNPEFWNQRYLDNNTKWDIGAPTPILSHYLKNNNISGKACVLGCGNGHDVIELSNLHRQTMFNEDDVGQVKVEVAAKKLKKINPEIEIEALPISINDYNVIDVVEGCDVVVDALDSVNARYSLNKACVEKNIPFVTGAAVGVTGQVFTVLPKKTACYNCLFPILDEDAMPTCSVDGVHPSILSIVGGMQVHEAVDVLIGKIPPSSKKFVSIDLENLKWSDMDISNSKREECSVCGSGKKKEVS